MLKRLHLRDGETVVAVIRRSFLAYCGGWSLGAFLILVAFFLLAPLFARGVLGVAMFIALTVVGVLAVFRAIWFWHGTAFVATDRRIIDVERQGIFRRSMAETRFDRVEDVSVRVRGFFSTVFRLGNIRVQTVGSSALLEIQHVRHPERVHDLLGRLQQEAVGSHRALHADRGDRFDLTQCSDAELATLEERIGTELRRRTYADHASQPESL